MNFGEALNNLKEGKMMFRSGWNGSDLFVFMQVPSTINKEIVPKMTSLPKLVKSEFERRFNSMEYQIDAIYYSNQFAIVNKSNMINGWTPSVSDSLANDWYIYERT